MRKILTIVLDGFGYREEKLGNAIIEANPRNFNTLWENYPHSLLYASEQRVGLLPNQFGNSEVGHMTIGAGRKIIQNETRIHEFLDETIEENELFKQFVAKYKDTNKRVHIIGLFSDGRVHADWEHFFKLYDHLLKNGIKSIYFHLITDGRDTSITSSYSYIEKLEERLKQTKVGKIATLCGRYYAMDRDHKFDRTKLYYNLIVKGKGNKFEKAKTAIQACYQKQITDEFLAPILLEEDGLIRDGDALFWMNYRTDRAKQILDCFTNLEYNNFPVTKFSNLDIYSFVPIDKAIPTKVFLEEQKIENPLGIYLSNLGLTQARIAETEKYAHVTYFFDGEYDGPIENCTKILVPSLKIKTYDLDPRMSAVEVTKKCIACMEKDIDFIFLNFANPDMVGHTGNFDATVNAVTTVDLCLGKLIEEAENNFYKVIVLADHGNADCMYNEQKEPITTHTLAKVPFIIVDDAIKLKEEGDLTNVAPTILDYMDIAKPKEMKDSESLLIK